jgi:hypothetical protein
MLCSAGGDQPCPASGEDVREAAGPGDGSKGRGETADPSVHPTPALGELELCLGRIRRRIVNPFGLSMNFCSGALVIVHEMLTATYV